MRILIMTRFYKNGQTTHVVDLAEDLIRQGHQVILSFTQLHDPIYIQWLKKKGIPHIITFDPLRLQNHLKRWRPEIIHNHSVHTLKATVSLGRSLKIPTVTTVHYLDFAPRKVLEEQDAIILISEEMDAQFKSLGVPTFVVENGITIPTYLQRKSWQKRALFLAQVTPEKEKNFSLMAQSLLNWGWSVQSAGNWRKKGVKHLGWVNDVNPLLKQVDLVIGTGRTIREGMAQGRVVWILGAYSDGIVTPDNVDLLRVTNFSGRKRRLNFSPDEAALELKEPCPERFQALGNFGRQYAVENFSISKMAKKIVSIYTSLLEG